MQRAVHSLGDHAAWQPCGRIYHSVTAAKHPARDILLFFLSTFYCHSSFKISISAQMLQIFVSKIGSLARQEKLLLCINGLCV
jgi:hypothetical protein